MTEQTKIDYVALVLHANVPSPTMKHILLTIAVLSNENGICRPSITRLEILTNLNRRTVTRNLKKLEEGDWLFIDRKGTPTQKETSFYQLNPFKLRIDKVSFVRRYGKSITKKVGAQNPQPRGTVPPNTNTPAPRPAAAPQAQAGGSGADNIDKEELETNTSYQEIKRMFEEPEASELLTDIAKPKEDGSTSSLISDRAPEESKSFDQLFCSTEPEEASTESLAVNNPYKDREYVTQAERDQAYKLGISIFELPEVRDEPEEFNVGSPFS